MLVEKFKWFLETLKKEGFDYEVVKDTVEGTALGFQSSVFEVRFITSYNSYKIQGIFTCEVHRSPDGQEYIFGYLRIYLLHNGEIIDTARHNYEWYSEEQYNELERKVIKDFKITSRIFLAE